MSLDVSPAEHLHVCDSSSSFFGHFSHRSEWQLIKIDYKGLFSRRCMDGDYQTWHLHNKVPGILNTIDLLSTPGEMHVGPLWHLNAGHLASGSSSAFLPGVSLFKHRPPLFLCLTGRAVRDGREADLYEAPAGQPLHAGAGLLKDLLIRALPLHRLWFWMVFASTLTFPETECIEWISDSILNLNHDLFFFFFACLPNSQLPFKLLIKLHLITDSCIKLSGKNTSIALQNFLPILHIYLVNQWHCIRGIQLYFGNSRRETGTFQRASAICIMSSDLLEFN